MSQMNEVLNRSVEELELSVPSYNCLARCSAGGFSRFLFCFHREPKVHRG